MDSQLLIICVLTFVIHLIGTLAYAARIAGVHTRRTAISFSLFNILILVSRASNSFQGPFLAKRIENNIAAGISHGLLADFRMLLLRLQERPRPSKRRGDPARGCQRYANSSG